MHDTLSKCPLSRNAHSLEMQNDMDSTRPLAMVTGASSGLGAEFAAQLAAQGFDLWLTARREELLVQLKQRIESQGQARVEYLVADLSDSNGVDHLCKEIRSKGLRFQVWINNAGIGAYGALAQASDQALQELMRLNVEALTRLTRFYLTEFHAKGTCRLMNVGSFSEFQPPADYAVYAASKAFVGTFTAAMQGELRAAGITATALCPGFFESQFFDRSETKRSSMMRYLMLTTPLVARQGLAGMFHGKRVVIPGARYKLGWLISRLVPRRLGIAIANWTMRH